MDQTTWEDFVNYSMDELNNEKRNVKNELKKYDTSFVQFFQMQPSWTDKEPMRPLYMYY